MSAILFVPLYYHYMLYLKNSENYDKLLLKPHTNLVFFNPNLREVYYEEEPYDEHFPFRFLLVYWDFYVFYSGRNERDEFNSPRSCRYPYSTDSLS